MQDQEAADPRTGDGGLCGEIAIHLFNASLHQIVDRIVGSKLLVRAVSEVAPLRPIPDCLQVDVDKSGDKRSVIAECNRLLDVGEEFELVLDEFRSEQFAAVKPTDIPGAVEDLELAVTVEKPRIAGVDPTIRALCFGRCFRVLMIVLEGAGAAEQDLAVLCDTDLDVLDRGADGVRSCGSVLLDAQEDRAFGHSVELLQVDAQQAVESKQIRPNRLARSIGDADTAETQRIL